MLAKQTIRNFSPIRQKVKLAIFDMDQILFDETLYKGVENILEKLKQNNYKMAIASYNPYAEWLCDRYSITPYFDIICGHPPTSDLGKLVHIDEIFQYYKKNKISVSEQDTVFYDDNKQNIQEVGQNTKINCVHIKEGGIKMIHIMKLLKPKLTNATQSFKKPFLDQKRCMVFPF